MKTDKVISYFIFLFFIILALFAFVSWVNPVWLQKMSESGKTTEAQTFIDKANREMYSSNWSLAASFYEQALKIDIDNRTIYGNLGIAYTKLNQFLKAQSCFENSKELSEGLDSMAYYNYYESLGNLEKSIGDYNQQLKKEYEWHYDKALEHYQQAIDLMSYKPMLFYKYAYLLMKLEKDRLAIDLFQKGIFKSQENETYYYEALFTEYVTAINEKDIEGVENIELLYDQEIDWERFDTLSLKSYRKSDLYLANSYYNLGLLYFRNDKKVEAKEQFNNAVKINPRLAGTIKRYK